MKTLTVLVAATALSLLALPARSLTQRAIRVVRGERPIRGEVLAIDRVTYGQGRHHGVQLLLKTAHGRLSVHLGPSWYVDRQKTRFAPHDLIEVTGSRVDCEGKPALIATWVRRGHERLRLRAADGTPLWAEQGRQRAH